MEKVRNSSLWIEEGYILFATEGLKGNRGLRNLWSDYLGFQHNPELAIRYFDIVRGMFYARISFKNFNYPFVCSLTTEARELMRQIVVTGKLNGSNPAEAMSLNHPAFLD